MTEWQDISTAPKDGETILAWDGHPFGGLVLIHWYEGDEEFPEEEWIVQDICGDYVSSEDCLLTHWMHLPEPPK